MSWGEPFILSSCSMDALLQRREQLRAQRAALADQNRQLSRRERRENQAQQRQWRLREDVRRVVLIVLVLAHGASAPLVPYLQGVGRRSHWPEKSEDEIDELALDLFLDADVDWVTELSDEGAPADPVAMRTALCIVSEWRVAVWTEAQNRQRGAAPSTSMVLAEFERHRRSYPKRCGLGGWARVLTQRRGSAFRDGATDGAEGTARSARVRSSRCPCSKRRLRVFVAASWWAGLLRWCFLSGEASP